MSRADQYISRKNSASNKAHLTKIQKSVWETEKLVNISSGITQNDDIAESILHVVEKQNEGF